MSGASLPPTYYISAHEWQGQLTPTVSPAPGLTLRDGSPMSPSLTRVSCTVLLRKGAGPMSGVLQLVTGSPCFPNLMIL